jgi:RimJ/RimL family protein N-acetyltransferase
MSSHDPAAAGITLRLLTGADADAIEAEHTPEHDAYSWFGLRRPGRLRHRVEASADITDEHGSVAIARTTGHLLGEVSWRRISTGPTPASFCWELGIYVLRAERGQGAGSEGQRLAAAYLFDTSLAQRVQASTDVGNVAEQRALENAGFTREGILRGYQYRFGSWHDMVIFSKVRSDP